MQGMQHGWGHAGHHFSRWQKRGLRNSDIREVLHSLELEVGEIRDQVWKTLKPSRSASPSSPYLWGLCWRGPVDANALHFSVTTALAFVVACSSPATVVSDRDWAFTWWSNPAILVIMIFSSLFLSLWKRMRRQAWAGFLLCLITNGHIIANINNFISLGISSLTQVWISCYDDQALNKNPSQKKKFHQVQCW